MESQITKEFNMILDRKKSGEEGSYTSYLFNKGIEKILILYYNICIKKEEVN